MQAYKGCDILKNNKKLGLFIILIIAFSILLCSISASALSKIGSRGTEVRNIQTRLKNWGYYTGSVDGIYGTATRNAVINFQKANGLAADGITRVENIHYVERGYERLIEKLTAMGAKIRRLEDF